MTVTILYLNPCRRERLRDAFAHVIDILGPIRTAQLTEALQFAYQPHNSTRINYYYAMHALQQVVGLQGLNAISLVKEAWNEGSLAPSLSSASNITHPSTYTPQ